MGADTDGNSLIGMTILEIDEKSPHLAAIQRLWRDNSATLGFFPEGAFIDYAAKRMILGAVNHLGECIGYLLYRISGMKEYRRVRSDILKEILLRAFDKRKDKNRFFSIPQKEQIWEKSKNKKCSYPDCEKLLHWEKATIDHIIPWSLCGPTDISNAQLMCKRHNSMKKDKYFSKYYVAQK